MNWFQPRKVGCPNCKGMPWGPNCDLCHKTGYVDAEMNLEDFIRQAMLDSGARTYDDGDGHKDTIDGWSAAEWADWFRKVFKELRREQQSPSA